MPTIPPTDPPAKPGCRVWCALGGDHEATDGACVLAYNRGDASAAIEQGPAEPEPSLRLRVAGHPFLDGLSVLQAVSGAEALAAVLADLAVIGAAAPAGT